MYKVSPSLLDSFRGVRGESKWDKSPDELIEQMAGVFKPSPAMEFGSIIHNFLETGESTDLMPDEKTQLLPLRSQLIDGAKEVKIRTVLNEHIIMSTIVDNLHGNIAHEFKTGSRFWGVDSFYDSVQWKAYALAYDADMVQYHHFQYGKRRPVKFTYRTFAFFPYEGMEDDIIQLAEDFIVWAELNGVAHYLHYNE